MIKYPSIAANTVSAERQVNQTISYLGTDGYKVLIVGNSITRHSPKPDIGWEADWGMAASCADRDYVHRLHAHFTAAGIPARFCIAQASSWERRFWDPDLHNSFVQAQQFRADSVVFRLGENVQTDDCGTHSYAEGMLAFLEYLTRQGRANVFLTTCFWKHEPVDSAIRKISKEAGYSLIELEDLGDRDDMKALGLFEHSGVAAHPGDHGMQKIADRIWERLKISL